MISFILPEDQLPAPPMEAEFQSMQKALIKAHAEFTEKTLMDALIARFGTLPSVAAIAEHCKCCIEDKTGVHHYVWFEEPPEIGDHIDTGEILCSIAPPNLFNHEN